MFEGGHSKSFSIFPIRVVYMPIEQGEVPATILISVSKRRFKRAVKRNRVKRQIREVYRKNKQPLLDGLQNKGQRLAIAFIYLSDELVATAELEEKMNAASIEQGKQFLEENKQRPGVVTLPSGLQYEVINEGNVGKYAKATDQVKCHYEGTLVDGTLFDSSIKRGQPAVFGKSGNPRLGRSFAAHARRRQMETLHSFRPGIRCTRCRRNDTASQHIDLRSRIT